MNDRVGIVMQGSCEVRKHVQHDLLKPIILKKAVEGDILGAQFNDDAAEVMSPLTWLISMQDYTEVIFFS